MHISPYTVDVGLYTTLVTLDSSRFSWCTLLILKKNRNVVVDWGTAPKIDIGKKLSSCPFKDGNYKIKFEDRYRDDQILHICTRFIP